MDQALLSAICTLRPYWFFERDYHGLGGYVPVLFTFPTLPMAPGQKVLANSPVYTEPDLSSVLDPLAKQNELGFSPLLAKFVPCPSGSSILFSFPWVKRFNDSPSYMYVWNVIWRMRSAGTSLIPGQPQSSFHHPKTAFGTADTRAGNVPGTATPIAGSRYVLAAGVESIMYAHQDPTTTAPPHFSTLISNGVGIHNADPPLPITAPIYPGSPLQEMDLSQGVVDPQNTSIGAYPSALFYPRWMKAAGDEFAVLCYKMEFTDINDPSTFLPRAWAFDPDADGIPQPSGEDFSFATLFGLGAYASSVVPPITAGLPPVSMGVFAQFGKAPL